MFGSLLKSPFNFLQTQYSLAVNQKPTFKNHDLENQYITQFTLEKDEKEKKKVWQDLNYMWDLEIKNEMNKFKWWL
jgi:hypothetical protein